MAKYAWAAGSTSRTILVKLEDSSSSSGGGLTGVVAASLNARAIRVETDNDITITAISLSNLANITAAYSSGGWIEIDATNAPGWYRFDVPDTLLASGVWTAAISIIDAGQNNVAPQNIEIQIDPAPSTITTLSAGSIVAATFGAGAIDAAAIADGAIDAGAIASNAITSAKIATGAITTATFAAGAINAAAIGADAITAAKIADGAIDAATFAASAIDATAIASNAITAAKIATDAITSTQLAASAATEIATAVAAPSAATIAAAVAAPSAATIASTVWAVTAAGVAYSLIMKGLVAFLKGKVSGGGTSAPIYYDPSDGTTAVITHSGADTDGNRNTATLA